MHRSVFIVVLLAVYGQGNSVYAQGKTTDTTRSKMPFYANWKDVYLSRFNYTYSPILSINPKQLSTTTIYNPTFSNFSITEKVSPEIDVKTPQALSFNEYSSIQNAMIRRSIIRDIEKSQDGYSDYSGRRIRPLLEANKIFDRIFGDKLPEFKPNGYIALMASHHRDRNDNPTNIFNRDRSYFRFDQQININFNNLFNQQGLQNPNLGSLPGSGSLPGMNDLDTDGRIQDINNIMRKPNEIREKVNIAGNFDTKSAFMFDNRMKLNFKNDPEDILQAVELGNISFPNRSQLIPGVQNLLGAKIGLKFGKLDIIGVVAQQNSRTKSIHINGGNQSRNFEIRADNYEENRHFFLAQYFRNEYENSLVSLPVVTSGVIINRVDAYVTNRTYSVETNRNVVGVADLGEYKPFNTALVDELVTDPRANNASNKLNPIIRDTLSTSRTIESINNRLNTAGLQMGTGYENLRGAKKLTDGDFELNAELGYISLRTPLRNDEVLAVAFEYTYRGKRYKVGELIEDYANRDESDAVILKMLKSSNIRNNLNNPMWDLMMKNMYNLGQSQIKPDGFQLRIIYKDDNTGMDVPFLTDVPSYRNTPLLRLLGLDNLNYNNERVGSGDPGDGNFDFIEGVTVNSRFGRIIFPVLEPFGSYLEGKLDTLRSPPASDANTDKYISKYIFDDLYRKTLTDAQQNTLKNKFFLSGMFVQGTADVSLPMGVTGSSVRVYLGGTELKQGVDYMVDQQMGTLKFMNQSILNSGRSIRVDYEEADMFQTQIRRMFGLRMDYSVSRNLRIGGTFQDLRENTPGFTTRTAIGNEPVNNTIWGLDLNYKKTGTGLTRLLDAIPGVQTKEPSTLMVNAEFAQLIPGVNTKRVNNSSMIDDFEFARNINDLSRQANRWRLGSTPPEFQSANSSFSNPSITKGYEHHFRRAKMSVYSIDMTTYFTGGGAGIIPPAMSAEARRNRFTANFNIQDILVGRSMPTFAEQVPTSILDVSYFPSEPGMYNYNTDLTPNGLLKDPTKNFGSIMRGITFDADFDNANVEYLEFWMMDPFGAGIPLSTGESVNTNGGKLLVQLGDVSEDVIPDSRFNFENGIKPDSVGAFQRRYVNTTWGKAPDVQFMVDGFENDAEMRKVQDVGFDGLRNEEERTYVNPNDPNSRGIKGYLEDLKSIPLTTEAYDKIFNDPSKDDYRHFLDSSFDNNATFIERYKDYLGIENNSPFNPLGANTQVVLSNNNLIDKEDINQDNTINELEDFFEYEIDLKQNGGNLVKNQYVIDEVNVPGTSDRPDTKWYLFRVPVRSPSRKYPSTKSDDFKSVRFMRLVTKEWAQPVVLRFATMQLVSNQYRKYQYKINDPNATEYIETRLDSLDRTIFNSASVSIEENGCPPGTVDCGDKEYPYAVPPGFVRDRNYSTQARVEFNEQSLSLTVEKLQVKDSRGVFKNTNLDLNMYKRLKMFVHMHNPKNSNVDSLGMFIRIGTDLKNHYYEVEIPKLERTARNELSPASIWPGQNEIDIPLDDLRLLKLERNGRADTLTFNQPYSKYNYPVIGTQSGTEMSITRYYNIQVKGNPDLGNVQTIMIGLRNNSGEEQDYTIWTNELRAEGFDSQDKGSAGLLNLDIKLADLGSLMLSGNFRNFGFGSVQDKISARARDNSYAYGVALNLQLDKFTPLNWGLSVPFYVNFDKQVSVPGFNPLDPDIRLDDALREGNKNPYHTNLTKDLVSNTVTTSGFNFMNVHKMRTNPDKKEHLLNIENFSVSYAQNRIYRSNILMANNDQSFTSFGLTYNYSPKQITWSPFKNNSKLDSSAFRFIKPFSISPIPTVMAIKIHNEKVSYRTLFRDRNLNNLPDANVIKYFHGNRTYDLQWNLTPTVTVSYNAIMQAILDDVDGQPSGEQDVAFGRSFIRLGRARNYSQKMRVTWRLPLQDIYALDWVTANATYDNRFMFRSVAFGSFDADGNSFGHIIENGRDFGVDGRVDFVKLYNKFPFLRRANAPKGPKQRFTRAPGDEQDFVEESGKFLKGIARLLMTARSMNGRFALTESTIVPGFLEIPEFFGLNGNSGAPGLGFVMGSQKTGKILNFKDKGWLSESTKQYNPIVQKRGYTFEYSTQLEPFTGFRMQIKGNIARSNDMSFVFQPVSQTALDQNGNKMFDIASPIRGGSFKMTFWSFKTSFKKASSNALDGYSYEPFTNFQNNREIVIGEIKNANPGQEIILDKNSQDVLIPAFFAAYTGREVPNLFGKKRFTKTNDINGRQLTTFNPFLGLPMPNWNINYQGLEKLDFFRATFSSITLSHSFTSTYSIGDYTTSLSYRDMGMMMHFRKVNVNGQTVGGAKGYILGYEQNDYSNFFDPVYIMSSIVMEEKFGPFLGVNFTTKGSFSGNFAWNKDRIAMLNLSNAQVSETHGNDLVFGFGMKKNNVVLPIRGRDGNSIVLPNDLIFRIDFNYRDLKVIQRKLDGDAVIRNGNRNLQVKPTVSYQISKRVGMTMYWQKDVNKPYVTNVYYTNNAAFGITARIDLSD